MLIVLCFFSLIVLVSAATSGADSGDADQSSVWGSPIRMFQQFVSRADGNRCPMYPSCSHYSAQAFAEKGLIKGFVLTCDRLARCGRDETRLARPINVQGVRHTYDPLSANTFWWDKK